MKYPVMKHSLKVLLLSLSLCLIGTTSALAGNEAGHGGDGLWIGNRLYSLDLVEAGVEKDPYFNARIPVDPAIRARVSKVFASLDGAPIEMISQKLSEISRIDGFVAVTILKSFELFSWRLVQGPLVDVQDEDSALRYDPKKLVQLAVRKGRSILIDRDLWKIFAPSQRTGLSFHEAVYAALKPDSICEEITDPVGRRSQRCTLVQSSAKAREIVGYFFTQDFWLRGHSLLRSIVGDYLPVGDEEMGELLSTGRSKVFEAENAMTAFAGLSVMRFFNSNHVSLYASDDPARLKARVESLCREQSPGGIAIEPIYLGVDARDFQFYPSALSDRLEWQKIQTTTGAVAPRIADWETLGCFDRYFQLATKYFGREAR
jgi:hypothetical protein